MPPPICLGVKRCEIENLVAINLHNYWLKNENLLQSHLIHRADDLITINENNFMTDIRGRQIDLLVERIT